MDRELNHSGTVSTLTDELKERGKRICSSPPRAGEAARDFEPSWASPVPCGGTLPVSLGTGAECLTSPEVELRLVRERNVRSPFPVNVAEVCGL